MPKYSMFTGRELSGRRLQLRSNDQYINAEIIGQSVHMWLVLGRFFTKGRSTQGKTIKLQVVIKTVALLAVKH